MALTQERAQARSQVIKKGTISYDFHVSLEVGTHYSGLSELTFDLIKIPAELAVDFKSKDIKAVVVNGEVTPLAQEDGFILLDVTKLKEGTNKVGVHYRNKYDNDGSGCVSFTDVDGKQYLYTQFQSYFANRVLALFDQPDLKATMRLNVISPSTWKKVLSNEYATIQKQFNQEEYAKSVRTSHPDLLNEYLKEQKGNMTLFPDTKLLPTYLFCFIAGEYVELKLKETYNNIPMSLYSMESLFPHLQKLAPFIFEITIESMKFFESFFGYPFSFNKYDQVFAHEYKWGAMQNAGIVTFNDLYVFKETVSTERMLSFANTISHELAHHWFGNLVTMTWWDDLWLNESFADFISHFCLEKIKNNCKTIHYESSMASFLQRKGWGYHEDQMITTHPIRGKVPNTSVADSIFDGITYSKGAATMKQLLFLMGEDSFSQALSAYFHKYEWSNATIEDFLAKMQLFFKIKEFTLTEWREQWLEKQSLNIIQASWNPQDKSPNAKINIKQTYYTEAHPTLRLHKIKVGLFKEDCSVDVIEVLIRPQTDNLAEYDGSKGYKAILLNFEDHTFAKNVIDPVSLQFFIKNINNIPDILSRTLIWRAFFEMVKDAKMTSIKFVEVVIHALANETSDSIFEKQFDFVHSAINVYTPRTHRDQLNSKMFNFIAELIPKIPADKKNRIVILKSKLVSFAYSEDQIQYLINWFHQKNDQLKEHEMTVGQKWSAVVKAFTSKKLSLEEKEALFEIQKAADPTDTAKNKRFTCDALKSTEEQFQKIYNEFKNPKSENSITVKNSIASGWNHSAHMQRLKGYKERFYKDVQEMSSILEGDHFEAFYESLHPIDDDLKSQIAELQKIKFEPGKFDKHSRNILKLIDDLKRRLRAYGLYSEPAPAL